MSNGKQSWKGLTGWVMVEDGLVSGQGASFVQYNQDMRIEAQKVSARVKAGLPPQVMTSSESLFTPIGPKCERCKQSSVATSGGGLCEQCGDGVVTAAGPTIACPTCDGSGLVEIPVVTEAPEEVIEAAVEAPAEKAN